MNTEGTFEVIWLEVADAQLVAKDKNPCRVQLKADKAHPRALWWPVAEDALGAKKDPHEIYREILKEIDKKRMVLAGLTWDEDSNSTRLHCTAFRFQSAELGSR